MSTESPPELAASAPAAPRTHAPSFGGGAALFTLSVISIAALVSSVLLWQRLSSIQEQLARQSAESGTQAIEARTMAQQAQDLARDTSARLAVAEARVGEVSLQRAQLEELMQSLSRSRDENLVVDIDAGLRLAQQQAQLTGSLQPLVAALKSASQRVERAAQPRLAPVQRAMGHDLEQLERASVTDTAGLLGRLDDLARQIDDLPLISGVALAAGMRRQAGSEQAASAPAGAASEPRWQTALRRTWEGVREETRGLVRVSRIDHPDAMLLAPDQAFFLRENLKLKLLNARVALLARRMDEARSDLAGVTTALNRYFDPASRRTQGAATVLQQLQANMKAVETPQLDDTFAALATAAAGR
ncbi:MAG: uroporphyrinogen-III C-methyltransferase [Proteobacteria bacterium]|nr:uroporphyrinogen-III C-methyltransferase [Pseudomonadota bacterium]